MQSIQDEKDKLSNYDDKEEEDEQYDPNIVVKNSKNACKITVKKKQY